MKYFGSLFLALALFATGHAHASVIGGTSFTKVIHVAAGPTATASAKNSGNDYASPKGFYDGDLFEIPKNVVVTNVFVVVDESVTGITAFNLGDTDAATGFVASSSPTLTAGNLYYWEITDKGAYLKSSSTMLAKYYGATGKKFKLDVTGSASTGKLRVFVQGYATGLPE